MYFVPPDESEFFDCFGFSPETYDMDDYILPKTTYCNDKPQVLTIYLLLKVKKNKFVNLFNVGVSNQ